jgi:hypothetical protein
MGLAGVLRRQCARIRTQLRAQRSGYAPTEICVLDAEWNVVETIGNEDLRPLV